MELSESHSPWVFPAWVILGPQLLFFESELRSAKTALLLHANHLMNQPVAHPNGTDKYEHIDYQFKQI